MRTDREIVPPVDRWHAWPVYWSPVILGALAAVVATLIFGLVGAAIGAHKAGTAGRITTWSGVGFAGLAFAVLSSFFAFVVGAWIAIRVAGIRRAEPAIFHGAISWLVAVFIMSVAAALSGAIFNGWYAGLAPTPVPATPGQPVDPALASAARNGALAAAGALLIGLIGAVIGGWWASGEPMTVTRYRLRVEPLTEVVQKTRSDRTTPI